MGSAEVVAATVDRLVALAEGGPALELAIGTGRIGVPLAARGVAVTGIELSEPMVARLRTKADAGQLPVVVGDMAHVRVPGEFALVYLVFNTISNLLEQSEQVACFRNAAAHLRPGGRFVVELGVPDLRRLPPGRDAVIFESGDGPHGRRHVRGGHPAPRVAPLPLRGGHRGAAVPQPAPLRLAGRAGPDGRSWPGSSSSTAGRAGPRNRSPRPPSRTSPCTAARRSDAPPHAADDQVRRQRHPAAPDPRPAAPPRAGGARPRARRGRRRRHPARAAAPPATPPCRAPRTAPRAARRRGRGPRS